LSFGSEVKIFYIGYVLMVVNMYKHS